MPSEIGHMKFEQVTTLPQYKANGQIVTHEL